MGVKVAIRNVQKIKFKGNENEDKDGVKEIAGKFLENHSGNLCKIIRKRFNDELILYLQKLKWWNWSPEKIFKNFEVLCSGDLEQIKNISKV